MTYSWTHGPEAHPAAFRSPSLAALMLIGVLGGCTPAVTPCVSQGRCAEGYECLANRCVVQGSDPVRETSQRTVSEVVELAVIAENMDYAGELPGGVALGAERLGTLELLLRFDPLWREHQVIEQAFLLLDPLPGARASASNVDISVWRIQSPWAPEGLTWQSQPKLAPPTAMGIASSNGGPLRIDVTHLIRYLKQHPRLDHGIALRADPAAGVGVSYATGAAGGTAPRIEVYAR